MSEQIVFPTLYYRDVAAALPWLERAFGIETSMVVTNADGQYGHCEVSYRGARIYIGRAWTDFTRAPGDVGGAITGAMECAVQDVDAHHARAAAAGARIFRAPADEFYGARTYSAFDLEGHMWRFSQSIQSMTYEEMSRASGGRTVRKSL